jgi:hypothetical protein
MTRLAVLSSFLVSNLLAVAAAAQGGFEGSQPATAKTAHQYPSLAVLRSDFLRQDDHQVSAGISTPHRALFCRLDDALDEKNLPLRFRLGSLEEVNRLEQKPGFRY